MFFLSVHTGFWIGEKMFAFMKSVVCLVLFGALCSACIRPAAYVPDSLKYEAAVFLMKNHTRGHDERIFEYRDGGQIFW